MTENKRKVTTSLHKVRAEKETQLFLKRSNLENIPYHERVLAYKGVLTPERVLKFENEDFRGLEFATRGYGIAM